MPAIIRALARALTPMRQAARTPLQRRGRRYAIAAYTVMEVIMALGVLSVGATGVIALQKAAVIGNVKARDLATASAIATSWIERLRVDSLRWKKQFNGSSSIASTQWLNVVGNDFPAVAGQEGQWLRPTVLANYRPEANVQGRDVITVAATNPTAFCTNVRLTQLADNLIRAEVRVFWLRRKGGGTIGAKPLCDNDPAYLLAVESARDRYHFVYMTTGILRNDSND